MWSVYVLFLHTFLFKTRKGFVCKKKSEWDKRQSETLLVTSDETKISLRKCSQYTNIRCVETNGNEALWHDDFVLFQSYPSREIADIFQRVIFMQGRKMDKR